MIISIGGPAGSGKSTIARKLAEKLGWKRYYIGGLRRQKALEKGMTLAEYNKLGETDPATDKEMDEFQAELGRTEDEFIMEGRTSWHFIPSSFKIYIDVSEPEGAERIFQSLRADKERNEDDGLDSVADVLRSIRQRKASDVLRYEKYYGINVYDRKNYDLVIDTTGKNLEEVWAETWSEVGKKLGL